MYNHSHLNFKSVDCICHSVTELVIAGCYGQVVLLQVMGDELLEILEGQRQLDRQFQQLSVATERGTLRETARGMSTATQGE